MAIRSLGDQGRQWCYRKPHKMCYINNKHIWTYIIKNGLQWLCLFLSSITQATAQTLNVTAQYLPSVFFQVIQSKMDSEPFSLSEGSPGYSLRPNKSGRLETVPVWTWTLHLCYPLGKQVACCSRVFCTEHAGNSTLLHVHFHLCCLNI